MNQLFSIGKKIFKDKSDDNQNENETLGDASGDTNSNSKYGNPVAMLKTFDRDGDGKITENG
jgi:hypothetical protein